MGTKWLTAPLSNFYSVPSRNGLTKPKSIRGEGYKFINMGEIFAHGRMLNIQCDRVPANEKELESSLLKSGDLLFARQSLVLSGAGKCSIFLGDDEPTLFESHLIRVRPNQEIISPEYLYYYFNSPIGRAEIWSITEQGAGQAGIRGSDLATVNVHYPSLLEQKKIASIFSSLDDKIELNRQMNSTLEAMAQALFKSWFVDFDPVIDNALAAGNTIPEPLQPRAEIRKVLGDQRKSLPEDLQQQFPNSFVLTDEMGWIPEGWRISSIENELDITGGGTPSTKDPIFWSGGQHPFCTPKDMSQLESMVLIDTERYLTEEGVAKVSSGQLPKGSVLMSSRAPIGYLAISNIPVSVNQGIIAILPNPNYGPVFIVCWAKANMVKITDRANGSTFQEISKKNFRPIPFLVPKLKILEAFNHHSNDLYTKLLANTHNIIEVTKLRDFLLPRLLSGELRVPDAEAIIDQQLVEA